jgi:hypothetical protein
MNLETEKIMMVIPIIKIFIENIALSLESCQEIVTQEAF